MPDLRQIELEKQTHPGLSLLRPFTLASEYAYCPRHEFHGDVHYALQFCIVIHGEVEILYENYSRRYRSGEIWFHMCWEPHAFRFIGRRNFIVAVNIDLEQLGACSPFASCNWLIPFAAEPEERYCPGTPDERNSIRSAGRRLFHWNTHDSLNNKIHSWLQIHQILLFAIDKMSPGKVGNAEDHSAIFGRIRPALNGVWSAETRPPSLSDAAKLCALSASRFSELFRKTIGVSYGKFALRVRMAHAAKDLLSERFTLEEIAEKWGFFDAAHFCHSFKKIFRAAPNAFLAQTRNKH